MIYFLMIAGAILNHLRGGGGWLGNIGVAFGKLPGRSLYWTAPLWGILAWPWLGWRGAIVVAVSNLLWGVWAWGRWYTLNRRPRSEAHAPSAFERFIERLPGADDDYVAFSYRNLIANTPGALLWSPWCLVMIVAQLAAYDFAYRITKGVPASDGTLSYPGAIAKAELMYGAMQGVFLSYMIWTNTPYSPLMGHIW